MLTRNLVFASTELGTYAIDRDTLETVWSTHHRGELSISGDGMLLMLGRTTGLHAYSLRGPPPHR